ncbi:MAG: hypothetical protein AAF318_01310 [Pseudomonadota bacterium]
MKAPRAGTEYRASPRRVAEMDAGLERIARWRVDDEAHLPGEKRQSPRFIPDPGLLDDVLRRPSLDERLPNLLKPASLDEELLHPRVLSHVREDVAARFRTIARQKTGAGREALTRAADILDEDARLDKDVRAALAAFFRA